MPRSMFRRRTTLTVVLAATVLGLAACGGGSGDSDPLAADAGSKPASGKIVVGSANFSENALLGEMYAQALQAKGFDVDTKLNIGSREVIYGAMKEESLSVLPEYNGALLSYLDADNTAATTETVDAALTGLVAENLAILEPSPAQDKNTIAVKKETADRYKLATIADLAPVASSMAFGGAPEDKARQQGMVGLDKVYGLTFKSFRSLDQAGPLTINALDSGVVDAAILYSTTPEIEKDGFVALTDPKNVFGVQNVTPLINKNVPQGAQDVLNQISAALDTGTLTSLNAQVQIDQKDPAAVAKSWLTEKGLA